MKKLIPFKENLCSKDATKMLSIKINNVCNRSCAFCVDRGGRDGSYIDVDKIAEESIALTDYATVIITGGEPFLNFSEVIELAKKLRPYKDRIVLNTNGTLLSKEKVEMLNGIIDELQVSIHHYDEDRHGKILGGKVSFENIKNSLEFDFFLASRIIELHGGHFKSKKYSSGKNIIIELPVGMELNTPDLSGLEQAQLYAKDFAKLRMMNFKNEV